LKIPDPYEIIVAGPSLYFLIGMTFFNWILIIILELKVSNYCINPNIMKIENFTEKESN
jgi:hypothetical protein